MPTDRLVKKSGGDFPLLFAVVLLSLTGLVFIYSASSYSAKATYGDAFYFVKKQAIGIALGVIAMIVCANFDYGKIRKILIPFSAITLILLLLIFVPGIGVENYGARRWISLGLFTLQPSELAKFGLILFAATYFSNKPARARSFRGIIPALLFGGIACLLIITEPNMSITVCVATLLIVLLFASGIKIKILFFLLVPLLLGGIILIIAEPYRLARLSAFLNPWSNPRGEGYQLLQSLYALGSGGFFGVGIFNSRQKFAFLPFSESDFILSVIGEEIGFIGLLFFFALVFFIVLRGLKIAGRSKDVFGFLLAVGITMIFCVQALVNALVVSGSIPPTGLPFPLVSSGNTAIVIFMAEFGVLFNVSKSGALTF
ncbi:MAG: putative lipid II flippase FtsW [Clostridia bacterium]|nr:putative lipid II flippase FtsW [Clostridia bacterium]